MAFVYPDAGTLQAGFGRPIVKGLFFASCLLSIVSFYTTEQGMALYLSPWFAMLAALGVQMALVLVAWLIGFSRQGRTLLVVVYVVTALISVAFSYVSLYTWFSAKERPALMQRSLYDQLAAIGGKTDQTLSQAVANGRRYVLALDEMTEAERRHGRISRAQDADPYLDRVRQAVAAEAKSFATDYREGAGEGVRYTAFERYSKLTAQSTDAVERAREALRQARGQIRPAMHTEEQLRQFRAAYDGIPWSSVEELLPGQKVERSAVPSYAEFVEASATGQEDLIRSFEDLFRAPNSRHIFSLALATFIDVIVFLVAFSAGPYFYGEPRQRWIAAGAALDSADQQVFVRGLLRKVRPGRMGMPRVDAADLSSGEQQICLLLVSQGQAAAQEEDGVAYYLLDAETHRNLVESVAVPGLAMRATASA